MLPMAGCFPGEGQGAVRRWKTTTFIAALVPTLSLGGVVIPGYFDSHRGKAVRPRHPPGRRQTALPNIADLNAIEQVFSKLKTAPVCAD